MHSGHIKVKTVSLNFKRVVGWTVVAFTLLGCSLSLAAEQSGTLSKKELKNLAASRNPADQQDLPSTTRIRRTALRLNQRTLPRKQSF